MAADLAKPATATRRQFRAAVAAARATVDENETGLTIDAPIGRHWNATNAHSLCVPYANIHGQSWRPAAYAAAIADMALGTSPCCAASCEYWDPAAARCTCFDPA